MRTSGPNPLAIPVLRWLQRKNSSLAGCSASIATTKAKEPFLCFLRRSCGDIVVEGRKVVGTPSVDWVEVSCNTVAFCWPPAHLRPSCPGLLDRRRGRSGARRGTLPITDLWGLGQSVLRWISSALEP